MIGEEGARLAGRYVLVERIGQGGMGAVWRARDEVLGRNVAIKELVLPGRVPEAESAAVCARMFREARSVARLKHPGAVTVYDVLQADDERPWIVMELISGGSLAELTARHGRLPVDKVAGIGQQLLSVIQAAHALGIVHRDIKPANVMLEGDRAVLGDFGIAALEGDPTLTASGVLMGTPAFMAPEQALGTAVAEGWDLWSLGATLYAAVEGRPPFSGPTTAAVLAALITTEPAPPEHAGPLKAVLDGLLQKDPGRRVTAARAEHLLREAARLASDLTVPVEREKSAPEAATTVWDPETQQPAAPSVTLRGTGSAVNALLFLPGDRTLAAASDDKTVSMWDLGTRRQRRVLVGHEYGVESIATDADATVLASDGGFSTVRVWNLAAGREVRRLKGHRFKVEALAISPDGRLLATADRSIVLWDVQTGQQIRRIEQGSHAVRALAFDRDGTLLVSADARASVQLWQVDTGRRTAGLSNAGTKLVISRDDAYLYAAGSSEPVVKVYELSSGQLTMTVPVPGTVRSLARHPTRDAFACASDASVHLYDLNAGLTGTLQSPKGQIHTVAFNSAGTTLAAGASNGAIHIWELPY